MSLSHYRQKRHFQKTPEPEGKEIKRTGPLTFVVQKHHASQLHYDFRLELDGVLKSWAIPKGPSLNPEDRRLAMMVEDHPIEYAKFEGIIPKGNYGAGTVMIWDEGVYSPYDTVEREKAEEILLEQLKKGHLTFILLGKKLKGEFALVKIQNSDDNAWLLIKKGDEYASKKDILKEDKSVISERSMNEIAKEAGKKNEVWYSKPKDLDLYNTPQKSMPESFEPMLAQSVEESFNKKGWIYEIKWDGYRVISRIESGKVHLSSRNHQSYDEKFAPIVSSLKKIPGNAVLDGEVVLLDKKGRPNFQLLQDYPKSSGELVYYVFDILFFDNRDLRDLPLIQRKEILKKILPPLPHVVFNDHIEEDGVEFYKQAEKISLEGIMGKDSQSVYQEGVRSESWLKVKTHLRQEAVIAGFTQPKGGRKHFGALVLGVYKNDKLKYVGHAGGGFDDKDLESILKKLRPLEQKECPFEEVPETNAPVTWVTPKLICEVSFTSWTDDGIMRHPVFIGLREDKEAEDVREERQFAKDPPGEEVTEIQVGKRTLKITHMSKVFWPDEGITKGDVINYYKEMTPIILPYLKNRPESLLRFPNGIDGESFFQKDASHLNVDWVLKARIKSEEKVIDYLLCQDEASLLYIINLGCIDLNPWNSTIKHLNKPDYLIIDLDPEDISFEEVIKVANVARDALEKLDIPSFPKTSGSRGLHIFIPMGAKYTYEQTKYFAELLCHHIQSQIPEITSMVRHPSERQGKVYLDFLQNAKGQTVASVYSIRAKPKAPVSTPLKWSEVKSGLHPTQFTIKNTLQRVHEKGDLFAGVLGKGINMEKVLKKLEKKI